MTPVSFRLDERTRTLIRKGAKVHTRGNQTEYIRRLVEADKAGALDWDQWTRVYVIKACKEMERAEKRSQARRRPQHPA